MRLSRYLLLILVAAVVLTGLWYGWPVPQWHVSTKAGQRAAFVTLTLLSLGLAVVEWTAGQHARQAGRPTRTFTLLFLLSFVVFLCLSFGWELNRWRTTSEFDGVYAQLLSRAGISVLLSAAVLRLLVSGRVYWVLVAISVSFFLLKAAIVVGAWQFTRSYLENEPPLIRAVRGERTILRDAPLEFRRVRSGNLLLREFKGPQLALALHDKLQQLLDRESALRYGFLDNTPSADWLTYRAFEALWYDTLVEKEGLPVPRSVHEVQLPIEDRAELVQLLKGNKELFQETSRYVQESYRDLHTCLIILDIFLGKSFGIHLAIILAFSFCVLQFRHTDFCAVPRPPEEVQAQVNRCLREGVVEKIIFCRDAMPQLGFIGTLIGLTLAILELGELDPTREILQRPGVSPTLAANLGLAFNTTLIALLLLLGMGLYFSRLAARHDFYRRLAEALRNPPDPKGPVRHVLLPTAKLAKPSSDASAARRPAEE